MEEWRDIPGYEGYYQASSLGRVRSLDRVIEQTGPNGVYSRVFPGRLLSPSRRPDSYYALQLSRDGVITRWLLHQAVCAAFHGARPEGMTHTRHLDGDRSNNTPANLRWGTPLENAVDSVVHGTHWQTAKTHCPRGHEYTEKNTKLRVRSGSGLPTRQCMDCRHEDYVAACAENPNYWPQGLPYCRNGHEYTEGNTQWVRGRNGKPYRRCRQCKNAANRKSGRKRRELAAA